MCSVESKCIMELQVELSSSSGSSSRGSKPPLSYINGYVGNRKCQRQVHSLMCCRCSSDCWKINNLAGGNTEHSNLAIVTGKLAITSEQSHLPIIYDIVLDLGSSGATKKTVFT